MAPGVLKVVKKTVRRRLDENEDTFYNCVELSINVALKVQH